MNSKMIFGFIASVLSLFANLRPSEPACICSAPAGIYESVCHGHLMVVENTEPSSGYQRQLRLWRDNTGHYEFSGYLVAETADAVMLAATSGKQVTVAIHRLSSTDHSYLAGLNSHQALELPEQIIGKVIEVHDGDSLSIQVDGGQLEISLHVIEGPELDQDCGPKSRERLTRLALGKTVHGRLLDRSQDSARSCQVWVEGNQTELSKLMLQSGLAWRKDLASSSREFRRAQIEARMARNGVWAAADQVAPWAWRGWSELQRNQFREQVAVRTSQLAAAKAAKSPLSFKPKAPHSKRRTNSVESRPSHNRQYVMVQRTWNSFWLNTNSGVRHNPSCHWYGNTNSGAYRGASTGRGCKVCGGAP